jgi:membrane glycosyltransferase
MAGSLGLATLALAPGGWGLLDMVTLVLLAMVLPWMVAGFWNAVIGFGILRFAVDPAAEVLPAIKHVRGDESIIASTAILLCIRNEPPARIIRNLEPMLAGLVASGYGEHFHLYVLSDTNDGEIAATEEASFSELAHRWHERIVVTYRRRTVNTGYKAGNIRDFCERWGGRHDLAVPLDADSFMPADAILRLVRIMQVDSRLGILQGLIVGLPSTSLFARIFQFGMRLGMRSYTVGSAWWQADCGPYWGHNAALRLQPFIQHCALPALKDAKELRHILSHDQIEAALMRSAGYQVRVLAREDLGWEENPPTLLEFMRRDLRWCQGNMQYWRLLSLPNLKPVSRYQLILAILMFIGSPAWIGLLVVATIALVSNGRPADFISADSGAPLLSWLFVMWFSPKIATSVDLLFRSNERRAFGGVGFIVANLAVETIYSILLCPILWISHTIFLLGLLFDREIGWIGQVRDDHAVSFRSAISNLWPQTLIGWGAIGLVSATQPAALPYILLLAGGPALAVPFAMLTAWPPLGRLAARIGIGRLPEETATPEELQLLALPAIRPAPGTV